jgi:hypothetical protein
VLTSTWSCEYFISSYRRGDGEGGSSSKPNQSRATEESVEAKDDVLRINDVGEGIRANASTTNTTPRDNISMRSDGSPSEPLNGGEHSSDASEITGTLMPENDSDSDSNF